MHITRWKYGEVVEVYWVRKGQEHTSETISAVDFDFVSKIQMSFPVSSHCYSKLSVFHSRVLVFCPVCMFLKQSISWGERNGIQFLAHSISMNN